MNKLLLIHPRTRSKYIGFGETESLGMYPLSLGYIAAVTPADWDITIVDEYAGEIDSSLKYDLVGITSYTSNITRAYELAQFYRQQGTPVVIGGVHASLCPDEVEQYADAVVIGEGETVWPGIVKDLQNNALKKRYYGKPGSLEKLPVPRRDLYTGKYMIDVIITSRGCPFNCEFCCIPGIYGNHYRVRPVPEVLDELEQIKGKMFYFIDDNLFGTDDKGHERVIELCKGIIRRKIRKFWGTQASLNIANHPEVLKYAYKSGCRGIYIGIESISGDTLKQYRKSINLKANREGMIKAIRTIHKYGMTVCGAFIFGGDYEDAGIFRNTLEFIRQSSLDVIQVGILTPYPGTALHNRLSGEKRLFYTDYPEDWDRYDTDHIVYKPCNVSICDLIRGTDYITNHYFTKARVLGKAFKTWFVTGSIGAALLAYSLNRDSVRFFDYNKKFGSPAGLPGSTEKE